MLAAVRIAQAAGPLPSTIAPQPLAQALANYARQTRLQVVYVSESVRALDSRGAKAGLSPAAALAQLLVGTGLRFEFLNARTVRIFSVTASARLVDPHEASSPATLPEIIITALRSEELRRYSSTSAVVWTEADMEASGIKGMSEIGALTPGVEFDFSTNIGSDIYTNLVIRGVTDRHGTTTAVFVDDSLVPAARDTTFGRSFPWAFDLERVEVLRGPQGTLLGQGTLGGAVRFYFNQPSLTTFSGLARSEWATTARGDMSYEAGAALSGPAIPDVLGLRVSGWYRSDSGYVDRIDPFTGVTVGREVNGLLSKSARAALSWAPAGSVRITPSLTYEAYSQHDPSAFYLGLSDLGNGQLRNGSLTHQPVDDTFYLAALKVTASFRYADLSAVSSYFDRRGITTIDWSPDMPTGYADAATLRVDVAQKAFSQDLRLTSLDPAAALNWVAGTYYSSMRTRETSEVDQVQGLVDDARATAIHKTQVEAYAQGSLKIHKRLTASAGLRVGRASYAGVTIVPPLLRVANSESSVTPKFDLSYQVAADRLFYLTVAKGYRSGSIEPVLATCGESPDLLPADTVWNYEIGAKDELLGGRVHLEASIFHIRWSNIQPDVTFSSNCSVVALRSTATSNGFELTAQALVTERLRTAVAMAYTDAHYTQTVTVDDAVVIRSGDALGEPPQAPSPWNVTASIDYQVPLINDTTAEFRAEDSFHSRNPGPFNSDHPASPFYPTLARPDPSTNALNLRAKVRWPLFELALFINNALDSRPTLGLTPPCPGCTTLEAITFRPRTVGVTANWRY